MSIATIIDNNIEYIDKSINTLPFESFDVDGVLSPE